MKDLFLVFLGGGIGSVIRYVVSTFFSASANAFPFPTFLVNLLGSFLIGLFLGLFMNETELHQNWKVFLVTGFCGGFTTFSAFSRENFILVQQQQWGMLSLYIGVSLIVCIGATALGFFVAR